MAIKLSAQRIVDNGIESESCRVLPPQVFVFINSERVTLVLEYTHAAVAEGGGASACADSAGATPFKGQDGRPLDCAQLAQHCGHPQHGATALAGCVLDI